jgi:tight adherence protein B
LIAACVWCSGAAAVGVSLTQVPGASYPNRSFVLSFSSKTALNPSSIGVRENGAAVNGLSTRAASAVGQSHFGTVLLIDTSGSMNGAPLQSALQAARTFVSTRNAQQPVGVVYFSATPVVAAQMTSDKATLIKALAPTPKLGAGTHMFDVVDSALQMLSGAGITSGSIILVSDGADSGSKMSEQAVAAAALRQGVRVYAIGVRDPSFDGQTLQSIAAATKGMYSPVESRSLVALYQGLGFELSNQYVIQYRSTAPLGTPVKVAVDVPGVGVAYAGYTTPQIGAAQPAPAVKRPHETFWTSTEGALIVSAIGALLVGIAALALRSTRTGVGERVVGFVGSGEAAEVEQPRRDKTLVQRALGEGRRRSFNRDSWAARFAEEMEVAGILMTPEQLALMTLAGTVLLGWLLAVATSSPVAALLAMTVPLSVRIAVSVMVGRQRRTFDEQLPDNLQVIASAMRAGQTFIGAMSVVVEDAPEPSRRELRRALTDEQLGVPLQDALSQVSRRMKSDDFQQVTIIATLQRETGGNTAEVVDLITETIRERLDLRRMVRALTAQGRLAGGVLSSLPVAMLLAVSVINPDYVSPLYNKPIGIFFLALGGVMVVCGGLILKRIVDIEV